MSNIIQNFTVWWYDKLWLVMVSFAWVPLIILFLLYNNHNMSPRQLKWFARS